MMDARGVLTAASQRVVAGGSPLTGPVRIHLPPMVVAVRTTTVCTGSIWREGGPLRRSGARSVDGENRGGRLGGGGGRRGASSGVWEGGVVPDTAMQSWGWRLLAGPREGGGVGRHGCLLVVVEGAGGEVEDGIGTRQGGVRSLTRWCVRDSVGTWGR